MRKKERKTIPKKKGISRRDFLKTAGAGAAAAGIAGMAGKGLLGQMFPPGVQAAKKPPPEPGIPINSAVIIGSGVAGLTAAMLLTDMGKQVTVLERCHRPGGRIQTKFYPNGQHAVVAFSETYPRDMDPETWWLLGELGLANDTVSIPDITYYNWRGEYHYQGNYGGWKGFLNALPWDDAGGGAALYETEDTFWELEKTFVWPLDTGAYPTYDYTDFEDWMLWREHKKKGKVPNWRTDVTEFWDMNLRAESGVHSYLSSAAWGILCGIYWEMGVPFYQLKGGNYQIVEELMQRIPAGSVKLNEEVSSVTNIAGPGVQVETNLGTYTADVAIVAVPHNKVASIVPELPSNKAASLESMGSHKCIIAMQQYSEKFWKTIYGVKGWGGYSDHGLHHTTRPGAYCVTNETVNQTGTTGIFETYINEPEASALWTTPLGGGIHADAATTQTVTDAVVDDMETYWPEVRSYLISGSERVYMHNPYGANFPVGHVTGGNYALNKLPVGDRIFFAGDYIEDFGVGDAILSVLDLVAKFE